MHFTKSLTALLASTAYTLSVTASPTGSTGAIARSVDAEADGGAGVNSPLERRAGKVYNKFSDIPASKDTWKKIKQDCAKHASKRSLYARSPQPPNGPWTPVGVGQNDALDVPIGLFTVDLRSCIGFGVTANKGSGLFRALGHFTSDQGSMDSQWTKFSEKVDPAHLTNMKGYVSAPDPNGATPPGWTSAEVDTVLAVQATLTAKMIVLINGQPETYVRPYSGGSSSDGLKGLMSIDKTNVVKANDYTFH